MKSDFPYDPESFRLEDSFGFILHRTLTAIKATVRKVFQEEGCDVTVDQWVILCALWEKDGCSQASLTEKTHKDRPTISRMLDLLEQKNLVIRRPSPMDRRVCEVHLTPEGRAFKARLVSVVIDLHRTILRGLTPKEVEQLYAALNKVFNNVT